MFSELLNSLSDQYAKNLPFVVYRKPKEKEVKAIFQKDSRVHYVKDFSEHGFVFAPFDSDRPSVLIPVDTIHKVAYDIKAAVSTKKRTAVDTVENKFHLDLVKKGISNIKQGEFKKVVLSRRVEAKIKTSPIELFQKLLNTYETALCYLWYHPKIGTWLGATPEILLKTENKQFTTMSLAGTQNFIENQLPEWGNKELEEQQLVTDYISKTLQNQVSNLKVQQRESVRAGKVWHLRTKLTGTIEQESLKSILNTLHPTPAVCGLPMKTTKKFILTNEDYDREYYTGFLGELNFKEKKERSANKRNQEHKAYRTIKTKTTLFVNLRCMQLKELLAYVYVGGGITQDSNANQEWQETVAKSKTMLEVIHSN